MTKNNSENYFKLAIDAFDGLVYICSLDNRIEYVNQKAIDEVGENVIGKRCYRALHGRDNICPWCREQDVFQGKVVRWKVENKMTGKWSSYAASPIFHSDGTISKLTLCFDITESKRAEIDLKESQRKLQTLMSNLPGMVYRCKADQQFTMEFASEGAYRLLGYTSSALLGKGPNAYNKLVDPRDRNDLISSLKKALREKRSYSFIYRIKKRSGETIWVWEQGEGIFSNSGKLVALEGFITDITRHKKAELDLRKENIKLKAISKERYKFGDIIGKSPEMQTVYELIVKAASNDVNVIIFGESGTGKELVAQNIHRLSDRRNKPFVTVNCGAINESLMESEFFGYKKGAFTGASADSHGYLDESNHGTLFLDELGEISKSMQILLLRAIDRKEFIPVGGNETKTSDFRIIAATHRNLAESVEKKRMREDFYYRIHILAINLPPLRERKEDISLLIDHFIETFPGKKQSNNKIPAEIRDLFQQYDWPGNIRELQNAVHRYMALGQIDLPGNKLKFDRIVPEDFYNVQKILSPDLNTIMMDFEKKVILHALERHRWNRGKTAKFLNIDRKTLYRKIRVYNLAYDI